MGASRQCRVRVAAIVGIALLNMILLALLAVVPAPTVLRGDLVRYGFSASGYSADRMWLATRGTSWNTTYVMPWYGRDVIRDEAQRAALPAYTIPNDGEFFPGGSWLFVERGFPFRCWRGVQEHNWNRNYRAFSLPGEQVEIKLVYNPPLLISQYDNGSSHMTSSTSRRNQVIPVDPIWPGLVANVLTYTLAALLPIFAVRHLRAAVRSRRGGCAVCGYQLIDGQTICPECGLPRRAPSSRMPEEGKAPSSGASNP